MEEEARNRKERRSKKMKQTKMIKKLKSGNMRRKETENV